MTTSACMSLHVKLPQMAFMQQVDINTVVVCQHSASTYL